MMLLVEYILVKPLPNLCQLHSVIHVTCVVVRKVGPANMIMRARMRAGMRTEMIREGMREGIRGDGNEGGSQIKIKSLI